MGNFTTNMRNINVAILIFFEIFHNVLDRRFENNKTQYSAIIRVNWTNLTMKILVLYTWAKSTTGEMKHGVYCCHFEIYKMSCLHNSWNYTFIRSGISLPLLPGHRTSLQFGRYSFLDPLRIEGWVGLAGLVKYWGGLSAQRRSPIPRRWGIELASPTP